MASALVPRIFLCCDASAPSEEVRRILEQAGYSVTPHPLEPADPDEWSACNLIVLDGGTGKEDPLRSCHRLRSRLADRFVPILFITADHAPTARLASLESGADAYLLRPFAPGELAAQVRACLRIKDHYDRLSEKTAEVHRINKRLQAAYQQIDQELVLARRIQQSFLPHTLPQMPHLRFAVHYRPSGQVGGDFYDIFRLDERHLGFYLADAMGHGVPASLLTIFVKMGLRAKDISGQQYRLVPPGEALQRLNRELIEQRLSETPFLTMVYALFNHQDRTLQLARSGHPYPLYLPHSGVPRFLESEGSLLGVFDTEYPAQTHILQPGDKLLLFTDGIDAARFEDQGNGTASLLACAKRHQSLPIRALVDRLALDLFQGSGQTDDLTFVGVEVTD
jgi:sigma-B regulation protein RsbU (phosphoserine phosphatase)